MDGGRKSVDHDVTAGPLTRCQITGSEELNLVIDLGHQPPCDSLLTREQLSQPETTYPLRLMHCPESGLAQLDYVVEGSTVYPPEYPYRSGISWPLREYQQAFADGVVKRFGTGFTVDIGCNDGTLLTGFKKNGCKVLGVEPTNIALIARAENGIDVAQAFFNEHLARTILNNHTAAKFITMTNVFAHMAQLGEVMRGISALLDRDGVFITESHYLLDVLEKNQFDTVYHEHIRTYSLKALMLLFPQYGMEVFHVERGTRYGGNIRVYVQWAGRRPVESSVGELLKLEEDSGLHRPDTWAAFSSRVLAQRDNLMEFLYRMHADGNSIAGCSAPGRCATLINYYGITPTLISYLGELHDSLKLGKYLPGSHIPVVNNKRIAEDQPDILILMAWHYQEPIIKRLRAEGVKSRLFVPLPEMRECG